MKKETRWLGTFQVKGICVDAKLPKSCDVRILFVSDSHKQWHTFLDLIEKAIRNQIVISTAKL